MEYVSIDEKVTTWVRTTVEVTSAKSKQEAIDKVIGYYKQDIDPFNEKDINVIDRLELYECEEPMTLEENDGYATIEIVDNGKSVWNNGKVC